MEWIHLCPIPPRDLLAGLIAALDLVAAADVILNKGDSKKMMICAALLFLLNGVRKMTRFQILIQVV